MSVSDFLAIIAIIVSFGGVIYEVYNSKKINRISIENKYYEKVFDDILLYDIPKAREYFCYIGGRLEGTEKLQLALVDLRKKAIFFKYKNLDFYTQLKDTILEIEDYAFNSEGEMTQNQFNEFEQEIDKKLEDLYAIISDYAVK